MADKIIREALADRAVDYAISSWIAVGVGAALGATISWLLFPPMLGLAVWLLWRFVNVMAEIAEGLSGRP
jgi:hypothetical protein